MPAAARRKEDRLIVHAPVEALRVSGLRQKDRRDAALRDPLPQPTRRRDASAGGNRAGRFRDHVAVRGFVEDALPLRIGAADDLVAARKAISPPRNTHRMPMLGGRNSA
jgi:hypothetical protein